MSKLGTKTYGGRKADCKANLQFDHLLADKGNKASSAKMSVAAVHRWGMTSFTSLRKSHSNGQDSSEKGEERRKKIKLDIIPSNNESFNKSEDPFSFDTLSSPNEDNSFKNYSLKNNNSLGVTPVNKPEQPTVPRPKKFFKSGGNKSALPPPIKLGFKLNNPKNIINVKVSADCAPSNMCFLPDQKENSTAETNTTFIQSTYSASNKNNSSVKQAHSFSNNDNAFDNLFDPEREGDASNEKNHQPSTNKSEAAPSSPFESAPLFSKKDAANDSISNKNNNNNDVVISQPPKSPPYNPSDFDCLSEDETESTSNNNVTTKNTKKEKVSFSKQSFARPPLKKEHSQPKFSRETNKPKVSANVTKEEPSDNVVADNSKKTNQPKPKNMFFRSKKCLNNPKKKAIYKHRPWMTGDDTEEKEVKEAQPSLADEFESQEPSPIASLSLSRELRPSSKFGEEPLVSFKCSKEAKELFTVVRNVKQAHQCHESGETQEYNDDIDYLLDSIQSGNSIGTRALGVLSFATKCMVSSFRIHLRAHGIIPKIFSALQDAPSNLSLAFCTSALMFVLGQDRLTMDLEASTLSLMLQLLEQHQGEEDKYCDKIQQICEQMQQKGLAQHLNLENVTTGNLAMETLLSLTSKRSGDWFKEELRNLGGLDHIIDTVGSCVKEVIPESMSAFISPSELQLEKLRKVDRCLRILETVCYQNEDNQNYLIRYKDSLLVNASVRLLKVCKQTLMASACQSSELPKDNPLFLFLTCLISLLKMFVILTHENSLASALMGSQTNFLNSILHCFLQLPRHIPSEKRFDILVLSLGLLINLVEHCEENREQFVLTQSIGCYELQNDGMELSAMESLVEVFLDRLEMAKVSEEQADALLSTPEEKKAKLEQEAHSSNFVPPPPETKLSAAENLEEILMKTLQKAGKHMEHSLIAAYIALLLGCVIQNNKDYANLLRDHMPDGSFLPMVEVLKKFLSFVSLMGVVEKTGVKSMQRILEILEKS